MIFPWCFLFFLYMSCTVGAMYKSQMIATGPANAKIYDRCVRLISENVGISPALAVTALVRSIYGLNEVSRELLAEPKINHIQKGLLPPDRRHESQVILPVAFLLAAQPELDVEVAKLQAQEEPRIDILLGKVLGGDKIINNNNPPSTVCKDENTRRYK